MLIVCDFDGTVTVEDITVHLWDRFLDGDWRRELLPDYEQGRIGILDLISVGYLRVRLPAAELLRSLRGEIALREGFVRLVEVVRAQGLALHVLSCGLDFYIRAYLPSGIPFHSFHGEFDGVWRVRAPDGIELLPGADFKAQVLSQLLAERAGEPSVYVGDGRNDLGAARMCDRIFAVRGSDLSRLCREAGLAFVEFTHFDEVREALFPGLPHEPVR
jgi:2-hydroxy-3-keto-5-methylthiopentenyl-1-phosphate phosphatase